MIMKRIEKVNSLVGLELKRENGEVFSFSTEDILDVSLDRIEGKTYSKVKLINGFEILYRNTLQSTFYQIVEGEPVVSIAEEQMACAEEETTLDLDNIEFVDENSIEVVDFYDKIWVDLVTIENEKNICFGLVDEKSMVYIPTAKGVVGERCNIYTVQQLTSIITEEAEINNKICDLNRNDRKFDRNSYELTAKFDGKIYMLNRNNCDSILGVKYKGDSEIGFVNGEEVVVPIEFKTSFFSVMSLIKKPLADLAGYRVLYRKYKKQKSTKGITDIDYTDIFSYMSF